MQGVIALIVTPQGFLLAYEVMNGNSGLTPRAVPEKFAAVQMLDVHVPTTDGRELVLTRHTEPDADLRLLLAHMKLNLPAQPPPRIRIPRTPSIAAALPL